MRESPDSPTRHQRYYVLSAATLSNGGNRNFVHMKGCAGFLHSWFAKTGNRLFPNRSKEARFSGCLFRR